MKVFLTGATGILGSDISAQLILQGHAVLGVGSKDIVLHDSADVAQKVAAYQPDLIIHSAAMTNVDLCEDDREAAVLTNVTGTENIAQAAFTAGVKLVYISSCGVYGDGRTRPNTEADDTEPLNYHHLTKLQGEDKIRVMHPDHLIIRPGWLFGGTVSHRKNFVEARRKEAMANDTISSAFDKLGSPTYTLDLARQIIVMVENDLTGTYNAVNNGCASRFDYVSEIVNLLGLGTKVTPVDSRSFPRKANMPANECLENAALRSVGLDHMRHWKEALKDSIDTTYFS